MAHIQKLAGNRKERSADSISDNFEQREWMMWGLDRRKQFKFQPKEH